MGYKSFLSEDSLNSDLSYVSPTASAISFQYRYLLLRGNHIGLKVIWAPFQPAGQQCLTVSNVI